MGKGVTLSSAEIEKLRVHHADEEVKGGIRVRHDEEQSGDRKSTRLNSSHRL